MSTKPFDACPYCLTEIEGSVEVPPSNPNKDKPESPSVQIEDRPKAPTSPSNCNRHLGYLSERGTNEPIPDDCLTCMEIVQCMLKKGKDKDMGTVQ